MPASKYERELRFIDTEVARLNIRLREVAESMPADPAAANAKAMEVMGLQEEIARLIGRKREIEESFVKAGMDVPDITRSMNATVHNTGGFEIHSSAEAEVLAGLRTRREDTPEGISEDIRGINAELASLEDRRVAAEIEGDEDEVRKLEMMASSLRSRRDTLVRTAREMRSAGTPAGPADGDASRRIEALEAESHALRAQVSDVRNGLQDVKEQLRQIMAALGIDGGDERGRRPRSDRLSAPPPGRTRTPGRTPPPAAASPGTPPC